MLKSSQSLFWFCHRDSKSCRKTKVGLTLKDMIFELYYIITTIHEGRNVTVMEVYWVHWLSGHFFRGNHTFPSVWYVDWHKIIQLPRVSLAAEIVKTPHYRQSCKPTAQAFTQEQNTTLYCMNWFKIDPKPQNLTEQNGIIYLQILLYFGIHCL